MATNDIPSEATARLVIQTPIGTKLIGQGTGTRPDLAIAAAVKDISKEDAYCFTAGETDFCWAHLRVEHEGKTFWTEGSGKTPDAAQHAAANNIMPKIEQSLS